MMKTIPLWMLLIVAAIIVGGWGMFMVMTA